MNTCNFIVTKITKTDILDRNFQDFIDIVNILFLTEYSYTRDSAAGCQLANAYM